MAQLGRAPRSGRGGRWFESSYPDVKEIGFAPDLISLIQSGAKTLTYRIGPKFALLQEGDVLSALDSVTREQVAILRVISKGMSRFDELPLDDPRHEAYYSKEHMVSVFKFYYGFDIPAQETVWIIEFEVITGI